MKITEITIVESTKIYKGTLVESEQLDELNWQDVKAGATKAGQAARVGATKIGNAAKRGVSALGSKIAAAPGAIQRGADAYTKGIKTAGDAVAGAANAVGRAGAETFKQGVARPVSGVWDAGKNIAKGATGAVQTGYGDVKQGVKNVGQGVSTAQKDLGNAAKFAGNTAAKALGGAGKTIGAVAAAPQGTARAINRGYGAGVNAIGGRPNPAAKPQAGATMAQPQSAPQASATAASSNTEPAQSNYSYGGSATSQTAAPTQSGSPSTRLTVKQIALALPTMNIKQLSSLKTSVDKTLLMKQRAKPATPPAAPSTKPNLKVAQ